jgi:tetratricopeptide (TPR) repeat protein
MRHLLISLLTLLVSCQAVLAQTVCGRGAGTPVNMQISLAFDDGSLMNDADAGSGGLSTAAGDTSNDGGKAAKTAQEFRPELQIRVQLQDDFGTRISEAGPNGEGNVNFLVCSRGVYQLRITGNNIEEANARGLSPSRGDKIVNIALRRKRTKEQLAREATISANRLKIPRKARKSFEKGNEALASNKLPEAKTFYEQAVTEYPQFDKAYNNLGVTLMKMGDRDGGKVAFQKAIAANDHFARALSNLAKIEMDEKAYPQALALAKKSLAVEPLNPRTLLLATQTAFFSKAYDECVGFARSLHMLPHTGFGLAHYFSARSLEKQDQRAQAIAEYQIFLNEDPTDPNVPNAQMAIVELKASAGTN